MAVCLLLASPWARAGVEIVEIRNIRFSPTGTITVTDPLDSPLPGAKVEEMSSDWKEVLSSTETDDKGGFALVPIRGHKIYFLQISCHNFNPLRVRVEISLKKGKELRLQLEVAT